MIGNIEKEDMIKNQSLNEESDLENSGRRKNKVPESFYFFSPWFSSDASAGCGVVRRYMHTRYVYLFSLHFL